MTREPVVAGELVRIAVLLAVSFGAPLDDTQTALLVALLSGLIALWQRSRVSPV